MPDKLEALRLAAIKLDQAKDAALLAEAQWRAAKIKAEEAEQEYTRALDNLHSRESV